MAVRHLQVVAGTARCGDGERAAALRQRLLRLAEREGGPRQIAEVDDRRLRPVRLAAAGGALAFVQREGLLQVAARLGELAEAESGAADGAVPTSPERRVGKECVGTCRARR